MKYYAMYDEELNRNTPIGYLFCYEKSQEFIIELCEDLDEWEAPLLFQNLVKQHIYTIPKDISLMWVQERVIPNTRQNIGMIMKNHKIREYSELAFLRLSEGRCAQDHCYLKELRETDLPVEIVERTKTNIADCFPTEDGQIICMFKDNTVRKIELSRLVSRYKAVSTVLANKEVRNSVQLGVGGYSVLFLDSIELYASDLREAGILIPISASDFYGFVSRNVVDTTRTCEALQCSRQNLSYLVKEGRLRPIIRGTKENLYGKGNVESLMKE